MTPNPSIQSGRAGSVVPIGTSQRPAADFERSASALGRQPKNLVAAFE